MSERNTDYAFVEVTAETILDRLTTTYEQIMGVTVHPSSPEKLFLSWVASAIIQIYQNINFAANQNLPSRATGANLDALAQLFFMTSRPAATPAYVTMEFTISEAQATTITIPAGTRVTTEEGSPVFATTEDAVIAIGDTTVNAQCVCEESGTVGNGYVAGQITECIDIFAYYASCANIETSDGGSDVPTDDEFYTQLMASEDAWSAAGPSGAYKYYARSVSNDVQDVVVNSPNPGEVRIYALMSDGTKASSAIKALILSACNADEVRPLTDTVTVGDPDETTYNIELTYYMSTDSEMSSSEITAAVQTAVNSYVTWQAGKLGRDINPSRLIQMIVAAGAKRVEITSPTFTHLNDGSNNSAPGLAVVGTITLTNGGYEDE